MDEFYLNLGVFIDPANTYTCFNLLKPSGCAFEIMPVENIQLFCFIVSITKST